MKKKLTAFLVALTLCVAGAGCLTACGGDGGDGGDGGTSQVTPVQPDSTPGGSTPDDSTPDTPSPDTPTPDTPAKENFTGLSFTDKAVNYDGNAHTLELTGAPAGATVTYTNAGPYTDAGEYTVGVKVTKEGYNDYTATAKLKINPVAFTEVEFKGQSFEYDGNPHSITVTGTLPATASVSYSSTTVGVTNSATEIGSYEITAVITDKNHITLTLTATLKITANDEQRFMAYAKNGVLYFQNAMDDNELYLYDTESGTLKRVSGENAVDMIPYGINGMMYISKTAFITSIKTATFNGESAQTSNQFTAAGMRYVQVDGSVAYYAVNGLTNNQSGIYKVDLSESEPVATLLSAGKAHYLQLVGDELYFADGANDNKLSKISLTTQSPARTLVQDKKIKNLVSEGGALYYTVNNLLGDYIEKYTISGEKVRKLTIDAGESLTVIGNKLYYVNVDKFTTSVIGDGIYSVSTSPLVDNNAMGNKVIDGGEMGVCSLATDGDNLYYYDVNGYKLMRCDLDGGNKTNLLEGFVKPEDPTPISTGSKVQYYGGNIYYQDIWDGKTLHCYNPVSGVNYAVTTDKVADFSIIGDVLYVNMVSFLVNNDAYSVNLKQGGSLEKISTYSAYEFVSGGEYVYYVEENAAGAKTAIHQCKADGTEDVIVYDKGVTNLKYVNGSLYFVEGNNIHCLNLATKADTVVEVDGREIHTTVFDTDGTYLYYRDMYGLAWANKRLARCKLDGTSNVVLVEDVDPVSITYQDGEVYYYSDTTKTAQNGLFKVSASASATVTGTAVIAESSGYYAKAFALVGEEVYFVDYKSQLLGNAHLYVLNEQGEIELIK